MNQFYRLIVQTQSKIYGGPKYGTTFDMTSSCSVCGTGAKPQGPLYINILKNSKHQIFQTLDGEIICSSKIVKAMQNIKGNFWAEIRNAKSKDQLPLFELRPEATMPPFSPKSTGYEKEHSCKKCQRDGFFEFPNSHLKLIYPELTDELSILNVLSTFEQFGNSKLRDPFNESVFARPLILVSQTMKLILQELNLPNIEFINVTIGEN
jgi:hypothetical protein